jgi:putative acyl-CoA dehydrogenase
MPSEHRLVEHASHTSEKGTEMQTHTVFNQATALVDYDMFSSDLVLADLVRLFGADWALDRLTAFGKFAGSSQAIEWAVQANKNEPVLHTHDRTGNRLDAVEFHPAYHELMKTSIESGLHSLPWSNPRDGAHVARAAMMFMSFQNESGHCCPISMTYSAIPSLRRQSDLAAKWEPLICSTSYDRRFIPASLKTGLTIGMGMTEKQGGSDVRANTTKAVPLAERGPGKEYLLTGHKWFCSAPMSDAFLMLAQTEKGVSCFFVPRFRPDGSKNNIFVQRLKDKLTLAAKSSYPMPSAGSLVKKVAACR